MNEYIQSKMDFKNDGLTVGELSITIAALIIIGFIWTNLTKDKGSQEVSIFINNSSQIRSIQTNIYKL
tara:strand:+ start:239 stop:442 length:204 start_codon:yes stop_codon:yes gene_type:complete